MTETLTHEPCEPITEQIGTPPETDLFGDFREQFEGIADNLAAGQVQEERDLYNGVAAERTLSRLGCNTCALSNVCTTRQALEESARTGQENAELEEKISMLGSAPRWLNAVRLHRASLDTQTVLQKTADIETAKAAVDTGELDIDNLLAGIENQRGEKLRITDLPELESIADFPDELELGVDNIIVNGHTYQVVDASTTLGLGGNIAREEYSILCDKLAQRMGEVGPSGEPQIFQPDNKMQKVLRQLGAGRLDEMRMRGKNRLYFTVTSEVEGDTDGRIVILGHHGGDERDQDKFLKSLLG